MTNDKVLPIPRIGLGTWKSKPHEINTAIRNAIEIGYRHFDCAFIYENEKEIGAALKDAIRMGDVRREDLWITSKLWNTYHKPSQVEQALDRTLDDLEIYYIDLYLMHWPIAFRGVDFPKKNVREEFYSLEEIPLSETWAAMTELKNKSKVKHIGVSNFSEKKLKEIMEATGETPAVNQIENHPYLSQDLLVDFCQKNNIVVTAYKPLGSGKVQTEEMKEKGQVALIDNPVVVEIAKENEMTPAQVVLAWQLQRNIVVIPKSTNRERMKENFDAQNYELTALQMSRMNELNWGFRYVDGSFFCQGESPYSVIEIWD